MFDDDERPGGWGRDPNSPEAKAMDEIADNILDVMDELAENDEDGGEDGEAEDDEHKDKKEDVVIKEEAKYPGESETTDDPSYFSCMICKKPIMVGERFLFQQLFYLLERGCNWAFMYMHPRCFHEFSLSTIFFKN